MAAATPFRIAVEPTVLDDLRMRLARTRRTRVGDERRWAAGTDPQCLQRLLDHWRDGYDWRQHEAELNALPQFKARVGDAEIHYLHLRSRDPQGLPLLLLHGWPDSFYRYVKVLAPLADRFELVVPSLPGFAFTGRVPLPAEQPTRHAAGLLHRLMTQVLGHRRYGAAGGDGGSAFAQILAIDHPDAVLGIHLTDLGWHVGNVDAQQLPKAEREYLEGTRERFMADGAYAMVQSTRPRSLAPALNDSPAGLASWIVDRFHSWSDGGDIEKSFGLDTVLTNIMLYWITQTAASSVFGYLAEMRSPSLSPRDRVERPVGLALFPKDIGGIPPRSFAERTLNVTRWTEMPRGSHFAPLEEPELYARDVAHFFAALQDQGAAR